MPRVNNHETCCKSFVGRIWQDILYIYLESTVYRVNEAISAFYAQPINSRNKKDHKMAVNTCWIKDNYDDTEPIKINYAKSLNTV